MTEEETPDVQIEDTLDLEGIEDEGMEESPVNQEFPEERDETQSQDFQEDPPAADGDFNEAPSDVDSQMELPDDQVNPEQSYQDLTQQETSPSPGRVMRFEDFIKNKS